MVSTPGDESGQWEAQGVGGGQGQHWVGTGI